MNQLAAPPTVAIYVPGNRPDRFAKAVATGADMVIVDLEDAVPTEAKQVARDAVAAWLPTVGTPVQVRVNAVGTPEHDADVVALPGDAALRVPKVDDPEQLSGLAGHELHPILETALGVERAFEIASTPGVVSLSLGEADLAAELGLSGDDAFAWIRSRVVVAARAAGLPRPMMSAYADLADLDGLAASCARGRRLGMHGRSAVHPTQVPVIRAAFAPAPDDVAWARAVLQALQAGDATGVARLPDGSMVDRAMARRAEAILRATRDDADD